MSSPENKSYLSGLTTSFSPWGSRSATPKPAAQSTIDGTGGDLAIPANRAQDHTVRRIFKTQYPKDCPPLVVQWYHAVDVPKRKVLPANPTVKSDKPASEPKKYVPFSSGDSRAIETAFQELADTEEERNRERLRGSRDMGDWKDNGKARGGPESQHPVKVPVNEDYLFDVDVENRELAPSYWLGPVYDVRRGTWFYQEGSTLRPCDENLATQLEDGYLKIQPWNSGAAQRERSASQHKSRPSSLLPGERPANVNQSSSGSSTPRGSLDIATTRDSKTGPSVEENVPSPPRSTSFRLFGVHMNSVVTYQDATSAFIVTDDLYSRMSGTVYERFAGGAHFAGVKVVRGYVEPTKKAEVKDDKDTGLPTSSPQTELSSESTTDEKEKSEEAGEKPNRRPKKETPRQALERQMSSIVASTDPEQEEEQVRQREEQEIQDDYKDTEGDDQGREIEHLVLVTHGIGQRLGLRLESVNFVHDVNSFRKTLKSVYNNSTDLQALNGEVDKPTKNPRVQVLPICWRHLLDFPKQSLKHNREEHDLGDADSGEDDAYPSLDDITVEGAPALRNIITDLALDILLYQSPAYKSHISRIVADECNRIYKLFKERNPSFKGKVSLVGHSLGSAIMFDILCNQKVDYSSRGSSRTSRRKEGHSLHLNFEVEDFYALGSPIGLFQMLKGRTIAARHMLEGSAAQTPIGDSLSDPFQASQDFGLFAITTSSPKCRQIFNVFHPTDPIGYRLEPLISPAMASLKPQALPYTKKGIFGAPVGQGLTGIGARVGQSVSGLWSSFSSGLASSLLNRSLGITNEEASRLGNPSPDNNATRAHSQSDAAATSNSSTSPAPAVAAATPVPLSVEDAKRLIAQGSKTLEKGEEGEHPPTLLNAGLETLYSGFRKQEDDNQSENRQEGEEQAKKLRKEESKVRALNSNGRVDYAIQEGAFDISLLASIASHLSYWTDEDVSHFVISQLLSRQRVLKGSKDAVKRGGS